MDIQSKIDASDYLSGLSDKYLSLSAQNAEQPIVELHKLLDLLEKKRAHLSFSECESILIELKARFSFIWALAEFQQSGSFAERGEMQTRFAELTIDLALRAAWNEIALKHKVLQKILEEHPEGIPGLFIFGMGKLGGRDLNFSSDIDLVAYFDAAVLPIPDVLGKSYICHQVLQKLTQLLGQNNRADFIWRVDWRLRPNASATTLAMSIVAAQDYYFFRASPWHRLALMKARVVAGDQTSGKVFLNSITSFIWRQNLDYRALDELAEIKNRINLEHPALKTQRQWREPINDEIGGFNVKLGSGGIREIEFIANALQLVWGGKHYSLRTPNTIIAIGELAKLGQLESALANKLIEAYQYLRRVENAIQILANQQTHIIPTNNNKQSKMLVLLSEEFWQSFAAQLNRNRLLVNEVFETLFAKQNSEQTKEVVWPNNLSAASQEVIEAWENGFNQYGISIAKRHRLKPLAKSLADYLINASNVESGLFDVNVTIIRLHDFFRSLPQGEQYFRLLAESPRLLESIIPPLLYSPAMSTLLNQSPHIIDCYMSQELNLENEFDSAYVLYAEQYEVRLERLRRFVNEHLYQLYLLFLQAKISVEKFQKSLSDLAEHTLELALKVVSQQMNLASIPITVLGMGKVATRRMSPLSDLDLIFIYDSDKTTLDLALKFVSRLQTAISTPMREGIIYELDTRLRPSGKSGAPIVSIKSFAKHQMQRAHTWEHVALVSSRVVAGDRSLEERIMQIKKQVIATPRDQNQFLKDTIKMWDRITEHRLKEVDSSLMYSKLRPGGLMQADYLAACLVLQKCIDHKKLEFDALLKSALIDNEAIHELPEILQFWRIQQLWERLLGFREQPLESLPKKYLKNLLSQSKVDSLAELLSKKQRYATKIIETMEVLLNVKSDFELEKWVEQEVIWAATD